MDHREWKLKLTAPIEAKITILVNSTFTDQHCERELLARYIIPQIRDLCANENIELEFTDLQNGRWIENELDTFYSNFCQNELQKCANSSSILINFLGDKYGPRTLPEVLSMEEYQVIRQEALALMFTRQVKYLDHWYKKDSNQLPPMYHLVSVRDSVAGYTDLMQRDTDIVHAINCFIKRKNKSVCIFNTAMKSIVKQNLLPEQAKFILSDFHINFNQYLQGDSPPAEPKCHIDKKSRCLVFIREFINFSTDNIELAENYTDVTKGTTCRNKIAQKKLLQLKNLKIEEIPKENIIKHDVRWTDCGVRLNYTRQKSYLCSFLKKADESVNELVTKLINSLKPSKIMPESSLNNPPSRQNRIEEEVQHHLLLCQQKAAIIEDSVLNYDNAVEETIRKLTLVNTSPQPKLKHLIEQNDYRFDTKMATHWPGFRVKSLDLDEQSSNQTKYLSEIKESILTAPSKLPESAYSSPVFVRGNSGFYKSAFMSKLYYRLCETHPDSFKIVRFFGSTPNCSTLSALFRQIIFQLANCFNLRVSAILLEDPDLVFIGHLFLYLLHSISNSGDRNLFILIAGLEKLSRKDRIMFEKICPTQTPAGVKLVLSMREPLSLKSSVSIVQLPDIDMHHLDNYISRLFKRNRRTLTDEQRTALIKALRNADSPLLRKHLLDKALQWESQGILKGVRLPSLMQEYALTYMHKMEEMHGRVLIEKFFGYLALSRHGLTRMELEDILSLDNEALQQVYSKQCFDRIVGEQEGSSYSVKEKDNSQYHARLPSLVVARILFDLGDHVIQQAIPPGTRYLINFTNDAFKQAANRRYLSVQSSKGSPDQKAVNKAITKMNQIMADYFLGKWANKAKPIKMKENDSTTDYEFLRDVPAQPNCFKDVYPNYRKLVELEHHLVEAKSWSILINQCLLSPSWLLWRLRANGGSCRLLIDDWSMIAETIQAGSLQSSSSHHESGVVSIVKSICEILEKIGPTIMNLDSKMLINQVVAVLLKERHLSPAQNQIFGSYEQWLLGNSSPQIIPRNRCGSLKMNSHLATWKLKLRQKSYEHRIDDVVTALPDGSVAAVSQDSRHSSRLHMASLNQVPIMGTTHHLPLSVAAVNGIVHNTSILWLTVNHYKENQDQPTKQDILYDIMKKQIVLGSLEADYLFDLHYDVYKSKLAVYLTCDEYISIYDVPNLKSASMQLLVPEECRKEIVRVKFSLDTGRCVAVCRSGCVISWFLIVLPEDSTHEKILLSSSSEITTLPTRRRLLTGNRLISRISFPAPNYSTCIKAISSDRFILTQFCDTTTSHHLVLIDIKRSKAHQLANHVCQYFVYDRVAVSDGEKYAAGCSTEITAPASLLPHGLIDKPILIWDLLSNELACYISNPRMKNILTLEFLSEDCGFLAIGYAGDECLQLWQITGSSSSVQKSANLVSYIDTGCSEPMVGAQLWPNQNVLLCLQGSGLATLLSTQVIEFETNKRLAESRKLSLKSEEDNGGADEDSYDSLSAQTTSAIVIKNYRLLAVTRSSGWFFLYSIKENSLKKYAVKRYSSSVSNLQQNKHLVFFSGANSVFVWDVSTKTEVRKFSVPSKSPVLCYAVGNDVLVMGAESAGKTYGFVFSISEDRHFSTLSSKNGFDVVEVTKDDDKVITNSYTTPVVFELPSGNRVGAWPSSDRKEPCLNLCLSCDGVYSALVCPGAIRVISTDDGCPICRLRVPNRLRALGVIKFMHFLPSYSNRTLFTALGNEFVLWSIQSGKVTRTISYHQDSITAVSFTDDSLVMGSASARHDVAIWDTSSWLPLATFMTEHIPYTLCLLDDDVSGVAIDLPGLCLAGKFSILETNEALRKIISEKRRIKKTYSEISNLSSNSLALHSAKTDTTNYSNLSGRLSAISGTFTGRHSELLVNSLI